MVYFSILGEFGPSRDTRLLSDGTTPSQRYLPDGAAAWASHDATEPARPRRAREMISTPRVTLFFDVI